METLLVKAVLAGIGGAALYAIYLAMVGIWYLLFGRKKNVSFELSTLSPSGPSSTNLDSNGKMDRVDFSLSAGKTLSQGFVGVSSVEEANRDQFQSSGPSATKYLESSPVIIEHSGPTSRPRITRQYIPVKLEDQYEKFERMAVSLGNHGASQANLLSILRSSGCEMSVAYSLAKQYGNAPGT